MANIYELTNDFIQVQEMIESGEYDFETLQNTLDCINYEIERKADGYARVIKNITAEIEGIKAEENRLSEKRKALENSVTQLKKSLETAMIQTDKRKFKTDLFSFNIQKNPPSVNITDDKKIPDEYKIPQPDKIDNKAIIQALKEGAEFDWAELKQTESLRIR